MYAPWVCHKCPYFTDKKTERESIMPWFRVWCFSKAKKAKPRSFVLWEIICWTEVISWEMCALLAEMTNDILVDPVPRKYSAPCFKINKNLEQVRNHTMLTQEWKVSVLDLWGGPAAQQSWPGRTDWLSVYPLRLYRCPVILSKEARLKKTVARSLFIMSARWSAEGSWGHEACGRTAELSGCSPVK